MNDKEHLGERLNISEDSTNSSKSFDIKRTNKAENTIDRNALPKPVTDFVRSNNGVKMWETDPTMLYDYSENLIIQAFVDTLAKDVSNIPWSVDNDEAEEFLTDPHPEKTFEDIIESLMSDLLRTGNAFLVVNRYKNGEPAEIIVPPANTMFKFVDDDGITQGYVQKVGRSQTNKIDVDDVVHIKWSNDNTRNYGIGPTEMGLDTIDIIDELVLMEILDLTEGGISKIVSQTEPHEQNPMNSQEWEQFKNEFNASKGERHKKQLAKGKWDGVSVTTDYSKFKLIDRYKFHIQTLGAVFKVNPSYVGFDFENTNRATDVSQRESYKERGIQTSLQMIKQKLNKLLYREFGERGFQWNIETQNDVQEVEYYQKIGEAVQELRKAGVQFTLEEDSILIPEDAELKQKQANKIEEIRILNEVNSNVELEEVLNKINDDEIDVDSVDTESGIEMTDKKKEFVDNIGSEDSGFVETMNTLDQESESRRKAIETCKEEMSGFSPNTYYKWLDLVGIETE